ncbi:MAG: class I SAM-dependent methyltransferase [Dermatophilaceae bacterium]
MSRLTPTAEDYDADYRIRCSTNGEEYSWDNPTWRDFFVNVARQLLAIGPPIRAALDVGCANGLLVKALVDEGVDARGIDVSLDILNDAPADVRDRLTVQSATTIIEGRYDLVTCVEVLEHMPPRDAQTALDNMTRITDRVIFTSTPADFSEPTHIHVRPTADWAADFAARGFYRRADVDLSFITPWAVYFERSDASIRDMIHRYESLLGPLRLEVAAKREALIQAQRDLGALARSGQGSAGDRAALKHRDELIAKLQHEILTLRDHAISKEASVGTARVAREAAEAQREQLRREIDEIHASERWRLGGVLISPAAAVSRRRRGS